MTETKEGLVSEIERLKIYKGDKIEICSDSGNHIIKGEVTGIDATGIEIKDVEVINQGHITYKAKLYCMALKNIKSVEVRRVDNE